MLGILLLVADQIEHIPLLKSTIGQSMVYILYYQRQILFIDLYSTSTVTWEDYISAHIDPPYKKALLLKNVAVNGS